MRLTKNDSSINLLKGIGMFLVIYAHNDFGIIGEYIYTFHMPLFFFISGYLENPSKYSFSEYLKKNLNDY
jgi:fucose 4-O-acetylase-like acetyltransferase